MAAPDMDNANVDLPALVFPIKIIPF
jgi:hypothetical protein